MNSDKKMVFAVSKDGDEPMLLLGIPAAAWEHMKDGKTHHFDLTNVGIPLKLMVFGGNSRAAIQGLIEDHNKRQGLATLYQPRKDFGIDGASS